jgi:hypothetical protein
VWCWGSTHHGLTTGSLVPAPILTLDGQLVADHLVVRHMSACEMTDRGELSCWGHDNSGMLADGTATDHAIPGPYGLSCQ